MKRLLLTALFCVIAVPLLEFGSSTPAGAACPSPLTGKDAAGTTQNFGVTTDASGNCYGNVGIVDGANAGNKATVTGGNALKVDGSAVTQPVSGTVTANQGGAWAVQQGTPPWTIENVNSAGQQLGANLPGQANIPLQVNQQQGLIASFPFPALSATQIWDGQHYLSMVPPNGIATQAQTSLVVRNPDAGNIADTIYGGSGSATENSLLKGIYQVATQSIPAGSNTIGAVNQAGAPWSITCVSGCSGGGGGGGTTELANSAGQQLGAVLPGQANIPLQVNQVPLLGSTAFPPAATQLWDGQHYVSAIPPNGAAQQTQTSLMVRNPDTGNIADTAFGGSGNASQIALEKGIYNAVTSSVPAGTNNIGKIDILGNSGASLDANGQNASSTGVNEVLVGGQFNTTPTTITSGNISPLQLDTNGNLLVNVKAGGGSGGTSSNFAAAFPSTGTAIGVKNGANMVNLAADGSSNLLVNCAVGCSASSFADQSSFTFGTTAINTIGGVYSSAPVPLASGTAGAALLTAGRILEENHRDSAGQELGASLRGQANIPVGVAQVQTALTTPFFPATGLWDGKNYASFAPASGSVIASQPALVTALSPNTPLPAGTNTLGAVTQSGGPWSISGTVTANAGSGTFTVGGTVTANQGGAPWSQNVTQFGGTNISTGTGASGAGIPRVTVSNDSNILATQSGPWTVQQGTPPWNIVNYDTSGRQLGSSLAGANNVPFVTTPAQISLAQQPLLPSQGLWDGKNYASFTPPSGSAIAVQPALVTTLSPNSPLPAGTNTLGGVTQVGTWTVQQGGAPWSVSQSGSPWGVSIQQGGNTAAVNASSQLSVNCANCSGSGVSQQDNTGFTFGTTNMVPIGGVYSATPSQLTNGDAGVALLTQGRILEANPRNSAGQEIGARLSSYSPPLQVNIASSVSNNTLLQQTDAYGQARTASMLTDGNDYAAITPAGKPPRSTDGALVVTPSPIPSLQCPFIQAINASATATIITGQAGKFLHICSYKVVAAAALSFTLNEGTGTTCGTGTTALDGGGSGSIALAANGGFQTGSGAGQVTIPMQVRGDNLCLQVSTSSVSGYINYGIFN